MLWFLIALMALAGGILMLRRKGSYESPENEPWRASLGEDEPLDIEAIRREEEEWLRSRDWEDRSEDEPWR